MANALQASFKQSLLGKLIDMDTDDIRVLLLDLADYTYSAAHDFLDDVAAGAIVATAVLASLTIAAGVFDSADGAFTAVTGDVSEGLFLYSHTGASDAARPLVAFYDTGVTGFPVTPNGGDINFTVHSSGWFAL